MSDRTERAPAAFRLDLEQQKNRAKELLRAVKAGDAEALSRFAAARSGSVTSDSGSRDSVAVSSASSAWSASFSDRAARVSQLSAVVQNGTYRVASAAISQSIVASATA